MSGRKETERRGQMRTKTCSETDGELQKIKRVETRLRNILELMETEKFKDKGWRQKTEDCWDC